MSSRGRAHAKSLDLATDALAAPPRSRTALRPSSAPRRSDYRTSRSMSATPLECRSRPYIELYATPRMRVKWALSAVLEPCQEHGQQLRMLAHEGENALQNVQHRGWIHGRTRVMRQRMIETLKMLLQLFARRHGCALIRSMCSPPGEELRDVRRWWPAECRPLLFAPDIEFPENHRLQSEAT